jgi:hypothetical protein
MRALYCNGVNDLRVGTVKDPEIVNPSSPEHAVNNAGAGTRRLTKAELDQIDAAFPLGPRPRRLPVL